MIRPRGQTATELLVVLAIAMAVLSFFLLTGQQRLSGAQASLQASQAQAAADEIVKAADSVWLEGTGSKRTIRVTFPDQATGATVSGNTIVISVAVPGGVTDAVSNAKETLYGSISIVQKQQTLSIQATDTGVRIGTQALDASPKIVSAEVLASNLSQSAHKAFNVTNTGPSDLDVSLNLSWNPTDVVVVMADPADASFSLTAGQSRAIFMNYSFTAGVLGSFSGIVTLNASNGDADEVDVLANSYPIACAPAAPAGGTGCGVSTVSIKTYNDSSFTTEKEIFTPSEPVNITGFGWNPDSAVTVNITGPGGIVSGYPKDLTANGTGGVSDQWFPAGAQSGTYYLYLNDSQTSVSSNFTVSSCG